MAYPGVSRRVKCYGGPLAYIFSRSRICSNKRAGPGVASSVTRIAVSSRTNVVAHPEVGVGKIAIAYPGVAGRVKRYGGPLAHIFTHSRVGGDKRAVPGVASSVACVAVASRTYIVTHPKVGVGNIMMASPRVAGRIKGERGPLAYTFSCSRVGGDKQTSPVG